MANDEESEGVGALKGAMQAVEAKCAAEKAIWQRWVRGYLIRAIADLRQLQHPPRTDELVQYALEVLAERSSDPDFLAVIGPFARNLPEVYRRRGQERQIVQRFQEKREARKSGRWPPLEPVPVVKDADDAVPAAQSSGGPMTDKSEPDTATLEAQAERKRLEHYRGMQEAVAKNKATWQADLRLRFNEFMLDYSDRNHPPQQIELAQFLLELVAEHAGDYDLLGLILPFAEQLPHELKQRREDGRIASEFLRIGHERGRYGPSGRQGTNED